MSSYFIGLSVLAGFMSSLSHFWKCIYRSCPVVHTFLCCTVVEYGNRTEHLFKPQHLLVPVTSVCYHLCITGTLQRHQGEIVNFLHQVHFTGLSTGEMLGNVCQAKYRAEYSSLQSSVSNGSRSVSSLRQEVGQML